MTTPNSTDFSGLSVALATPFTSSGEVDMKAFRAVVKHVAEGGAEALLGMPHDYWVEIGAIGTIDDALSHIAALEAAGVGSVNIFPGPELDVAWEQLPQVAALATR